MRTLHLFLCFCIHFCVIFSHANDTEEHCLRWRAAMNTVKNLENGIQFCKQTLPNVSPKCKVAVYIELGELFYRKLIADSSYYYYDTAIALAKELEEDEALSDAYNGKITMLMKYEKYDEIHVLLKASKQLLQPYPNSKSWIRYYEQSAYIVFMNEDYYQAIDYMDSTIIAAKRSNHHDLVHETYEHLGLCYSFLGNYEKSTENYIKAIEIKERTGHTKDLGGTYRYLGGSYFKWKQFDKAKHYILKAIAHNTENDHQLDLMVGYYKLAQCNRQLALNEAAKTAIESAIDFAEKSNLISYKSDYYKEKGLLYFYNYKQLDTAEIYLKKAYQLAGLSKEKRAKFQCIISLIELYDAQKKYTKIKELFHELEAIKNTSLTIEYQAKLAEIYSHYYEKTQQPLKALASVRTYHRLKDSLLNKEIYEKTALLEKRYDTNKKQLAIVTLKKEKQAQEQLIQKANFRQKLYTFYVFLLIGFLLIGTWVFLKIQKQSKQLNQQRIDTLFQEQELQLIKASIDGQRKERKRVGQTLHDSIGSNLAAIKLQFSNLPKNPTSLHTIYEQLDETYQQVRTLSHNLIPKKISQHNFVQLLTEYVTNIANSSVLTIQITAYPEIVINQLSEQVQNQLFMSIQELITNTIKHAQATEVSIQLDAIDTRICLIYEDNGKGFDPTSKKRGIGLSNIQSRIDELSGTLSIDSHHKRGTIVTIEIPNIPTL